MSRCHVTTRLIDGVPTNCIDVGCDDFDRAAYNQRIIKDKLLVEAYLVQEAQEQRDKDNHVKLPPWIPRRMRRDFRDYLL